MFDRWRIAAAAGLLLVASMIACGRARAEDGKASPDAKKAGSAPRKQKNAPKTPPATIPPLLDKLAITPSKAARDQEKVASREGWTTLRWAALVIGDPVALLGNDFPGWGDRSGGERDREGLAGGRSAVLL